MGYRIKDFLKVNNSSKPKTIYEYMLHYYDTYKIGSYTFHDVVKFIPLLDFDIIISVDGDLSNYDWYEFVSTVLVAVISTYVMGTDELTNVNSDIISNHIFSNFGDYEILSKIMCYFDDDYTQDDTTILRGIFSRIIGNIFSRNKEKYEKIYKANEIAFNPLWNVDGTEVTTRTLERDGTETTTKTGTVADAKTGTVATAKTGTETTDHDNTVVEAHTGTDTNAKSGTETTTNTGTVADAKTGSDTTTKNGQEDRTIDVGVSAYNSSTMTPKESTTDNLQYTNIQEQTTHNTTDTTTHNTTDTLTHNTTDLETLNLNDRTTIDETTEITHNTTDTTTHNTTNTTTNNTTDRLALDTVDTEHISVTRQGNIGVTTTTKLLTEYVDFANYVDFVNTISTDIIREICYTTL